MVSVCAIEVKAASSVSSKDVNGLSYLREKLGDQFVNGVVLYTGESVLPFGERITLLPLSALWS